MLKTRSTKLETGSERDQRASLIQIWGCWGVILDLMFKPWWFQESVKKNYIGYTLGSSGTYLEANFQATPRGLKSVAARLAKKHLMKLDQAS